MSAPRLAGADVLYSLSQVARLTGIRPDQLRRWHHSGLLPARELDDGHRGYSFPDVIAARTASGLIEQGVTTRRVREAVEAVRAWDLDARAQARHPLASLRVYAEAGRLVVKLDDALVEPDSGQLLLDLPVGEVQRCDEPSAEIIAVPIPSPVDDADAWVRRGMNAEKDGRPDEARHLYERALERQAEHPGALVNLGNMLYVRGQVEEAAAHYRRATGSAPEYSDAWYNLANVLDDMGAPDAAVQAYERALDIEPDYADAHFNLALLWEKMGQRSAARGHWSRYLRLEPQGASAAIARRFLLDDSER